MSPTRVQVMGVVNVTDDSFFEGARSETPEGAVKDGLTLAAAGFDLLDVGAVRRHPRQPIPLAVQACWRSRSLATFCSRSLSSLSEGRCAVGADIPAMKGRRVLM